jgi:hypothetical protein
VIWALALATDGVADGLTTAMIVLRVPPSREADPVVSAAIDALGASGLVRMRSPAVAACFVISVSGHRNDAAGCHVGSVLPKPRRARTHHLVSRRSLCRSDRYRVDHGTERIRLVR